MTRTGCGLCETKVPCEDRIPAAVHEPLRSEEHCETHKLQTEIEIDADADRVWTILVDFAAYPEWNPFTGSLPKARGCKHIFTRAARRE